MAGETVLDSLVVKLLGDQSSYSKMLKDAERETDRTTKQLNAAFDKFSGGTKELDEAGDKLKKLAEMFGQEGLAGKIGIADAEYTKLAGNVVSKAGELKDTALMVSGAWTKGMAAMGAASATLSAQFGKVSKSGSALASGAAFGLKGVAVAAAAVTVGLAAKAVYDYAASVEALNKELERSRVEHEKTVGVYEKATQALLDQSELLPEAKKRNAFLFDEWEKASATLDDAGESADELSKKLGTSKLASGLTRTGAAAAMKALFGWEPGEAAEQLEKELVDVRRRAEEGSIGAQAGVWAKDLAGWVGGLWDTEEAKRLSAELAKVNKEGEAAQKRIDGIVEKLIDAGRNADKAFAGVFGALQMENLTAGMGEREKVMFALQQQVEKLKGSMDALSEAGEIDKAEAVGKKIDLLNLELAEVGRLFDERAAHKGAADFKAFAREVERSTNALTMTAAAFRQWDVSRRITLGGGTVTAQMEKEIARLAQAEEQVRETQRSWAEAQAVTDRFDPGSRLTKEGERLTELFEAGFLESAVYAKAMEDLQKRYDAVAGEARKAAREVQRFDAALVGSAEDARRIARQFDIFARRGGPISAMAKAAMARGAEGAGGGFYGRDDEAGEDAGAFYAKGAEDYAPWVHGPEREVFPAVHEFYEPHGPPAPYVPMGPGFDISERPGVIVEEGGDSWWDWLGKFTDSADAILNPLTFEAKIAPQAGVFGSVAGGQQQVIDLLQKIADNVAKSAEKKSVEIEEADLEG